MRNLSLIRILLTVACGIMAFSAFGQSIIPRVGLSLSTLDLGERFVGPAYETEYKPGIIAGAEGEFSFNQKFGITLSLLYSQQGWNGKEKFGTINFTEKIRLDYLDMSVMPFVKLQPLYLMAGPVLGIGIGGRTERTMHYSNGPIITEGKPSFDHPLNFAGQLAVGVIIHKRTFVDIRYRKSFSNFYDSIDDTKSKLNSIQLTAGFLFGKNKA